MPMSASHVRGYSRRTPNELRQYSYPGAFEGELEIAQYYYDLLMDGFGGEELDFGDGETYAEVQADVEDIETRARENGDQLTNIEKDFIRRHPFAVVSTSSSGFVSVDYFETESALRKAMAPLEKEYDRIVESVEDEEGY